MRPTKRSLRATSRCAGKADLWGRSGIEPPIAELLSDPIALLLMRADGLRPSDVEAVLHDTRTRHRNPERSSVRRHRDLIWTAEVRA